MAKRQGELESLLRKNIGKDAADTMLAKVDKMVKQGATASQIERTIAADLQAHIEQLVVSTVVAKIGPLTPIKVKPIQVQIKPSIKPIVVSPKINTGVSVKVSPGI